MQIPFSPLPFNVLKKASTPFIPIGWRFNNFFPQLELQLRQAEMDISPRDYLAIMFFLTTFYFVLFGLLFPAILSKFTPNFLLIGLTVAIIVSFLVLVQLSMYPTMQTRKKERQIEKNLIFALRTMLVEIKGGVGLFGAMQLIATSNFGLLSKEFKKAVDRINTGSTYDAVLQDMATENTSFYLRKALWQIIDGMKSGADVSDIITETVKTAARDQRIAITRYGAELRLLSLVYMMIGVIVPALGLTFLIVMGSFPQIKITESIFWIFLASIVIMQFMYMGIIKSRRPTIIS